jgi:hypothetical protein
MVTLESTDDDVALLFALEPAEEEGGGRDVVADIERGEEFPRTKDVLGAPPLLRKESEPPLLLEESEVPLDTPLLLEESLKGLEFDVDRLPGVDLLAATREATIDRVAEVDLGEPVRPPA